MMKTTLRKERGWVGVSALCHLSLPGRVGVPQGPWERGVNLHCSGCLPAEPTLSHRPGTQPVFGIRPSQAAGVVWSGLRVLGSCLWRNLADPLKSLLHSLCLILPGAGHLSEVWILEKSMFLSSFPGGKPWKPGETHWGAAHESASAGLRLPSGTIKPSTWCLGWGGRSVGTGSELLCTPCHLSG